MPRTLTLRVKKICQKITNTTDINLTVIPIKKNGTTGVTIGYQFRSEFKNQKTITKIEDVKIIDSKPRSNRQQLSNWGVSKKQIDTWIANLTPKTNGMVERVNGTIKNATVKAITYQNIDEMKQDLNKFLIFYNFNRGHGGLCYDTRGCLEFNLQVQHILSGFTTLLPTFKNHTPKHIRLSDKQIRLQIIPIL
jgi:hypothetical protein